MHKIKSRLVTLVILLFFALAVSGFAEGEAEFVRQNYLGISEVEIESTFYSFVIEGSSGAVTEVDARDIDRRVRLTSRVVAGRLILQVERRFDFFRTGSREPIVVSVPRGVHVNASSGSGSFLISGIESDVYMRTASGSIRGDDLHGSIDIGSASGSIRIEEVSGKISVRSASGSIRLEQIDGRLDANTASGSIQIDTIRGSIAAKTVSGSISIAEFFADDSSSFASTSGAIRVDLTNQAGSFTFDLRSTSGSLAVSDQTASRQFKAGNGPIRITGNTTSGSQRYY